MSPTQRGVDKSVIPDWLSFRCGENGADDPSSGAACGSLLGVGQITHGDVVTGVAEAGGAAVGNCGSNPCAAAVALLCWRAS